VTHFRKSVADLPGRLAALRGINRNDRTATIAMALAVIMGLYCSTAMADSSSCGNATVQGDYGQLANATLPPSGGEEGGPVSSTPLVTVGLRTFDGKGGITGRATGVMAGVTTPVTVHAT
jgi:hypothetical protein